MILLETARLKIRSFDDSDFDYLVTLMSDAETMKYTGFKTPQSLERIRELLAKWKVEGEKILGVWAVESTSPQAFVGWVMLKPTVSETPELGYMFLRDQWAKGFASELGVAILRYAQTLKIPKIKAVTSVKNAASVRVLEKIGMRVDVAHPPQAGELHYVIEFA